MPPLDAAQGPHRRARSPSDQGADTAVAGADVVVVVGTTWVVVVALAGFVDVAGEDGALVRGGDDGGDSTRGRGDHVVGVKGRNDSASGDAVVRGSTGVSASAWRM
jgi:hypothetical protein